MTDETTTAEPAGPGPKQVGPVEARVARSVDNVAAILLSIATVATA